MKYSMIKQLILMGCLCGAVSAQATWRTFHGDVDLRGVSSSPMPDTLELLWRFNSGDTLSSAPVSDGVSIFVAGDHGIVCAVDLKGEKIWEQTLMRVNSSNDIVAERLNAPLLVMGGQLFVGSSRGTFYALDAATGDVSWSHFTDGSFNGTPIDDGAGNVVALDQSEGALMCWNAESGALLWKTEGVERSDGSPSIAQKRIVFGSCLAALHVYSDQGAAIAEIEVGGDGQIAGGVAIDGARAFAGDRSGRLLCFDLEQGALLWQTDAADDSTFSTPALAGNRVVYAGDDGFVRAVDAQTGSLLWEWLTDGLPTSPVIWDTHVLVSVDGVLIVLRLSDGVKVRTIEMSDEITSPALVAGCVVVGADDGTLSAYGAK